MPGNDEMDERRLDEAVVVALGSNLKGEYPSVQALLEAALDRFAAEGLNLLARSSWWRSAAWPDPSAPAYLNGVAVVETTSGPLATLAALRRIEAAFGRERGAANASRTLDLDLIAHARTVMDTPDLVLPHPRASERRFVMGPLAEIAPAWIHPVAGGSAAELAARATVGVDAAPVA
jgi:2-amino-4-hydroxy-6-hydroxymethyldihydropteridine diphosphokinase